MESHKESFFAAQQKNMIDRILYATKATTEHAIREDLRICHRLIAKFGLDELTWNHVSARCAATADDEEDCCDLSPDTYLITPGGLHFSEIRSEDLVFDTTEEPGNIIHSGIYAARPDIRSIIHVHTPYTQAVGVLKEGFMFLNQDSAAFYNKIGYHEWEGVHTSEEEKDRIVDNLGPEGMVLFLRNHGVVVCGRTIQEAFVKLYYLEKACKLQMDVLATNREFVECSESLLLHAQKQQEKLYPHGKFEWRALKKLAERV